MTDVVEVPPQIQDVLSTYADLLEKRQGIKIGVFGCGPNAKRPGTPYVGILSTRKFLFYLNVVTPQGIPEWARIKAMQTISEERKKAADLTKFENL